ncbi:ATP-binding cassette domain-containing protein [Pedobacter metabolipauper]|uniref:ABC-type lipopolysaccharide export system ATPase subunit n=1 Tax=Pedobacter metabolipauper TaxID=425513 RepID=A0A4V3D0L9_9SPHI|nr:ATP-binding cassette domain-containing protein [Pedobacter metabolipauper]TDQ06410.1 ABC-type lipopolysaccharide export system ATPase subunit [Pedobacter metabolipauper]
MIHKLEADSIFLEFGVRKILSDIYIQCETGKITGLLGRNGNGKTSLMNIIYGNLTANSKSVRFDGQSIPCAYKRPELHLYLPQFNFIPDGLSLKRIFLDFNLDYIPFEDLFPEFRLKYNSPLKKLSGGQKRLIELYVILKSPTQFVMLDEPFSHLSPLMVEQIKTLMVAEKENKGLLITDHMHRDVISISDDLYVLSGGKTHLTKSPEEIEFLGYAKF